MNKEELKNILESENVNPKMYSLEGEQNELSIHLSQDGPSSWFVYIYDRGRRIDLGRFTNENDACECLFAQVMKYHRRK